MDVDRSLPDARAGRAHAPAVFQAGHPARRAHGVGAAGQRVRGRRALRHHGRAAGRARRSASKCSSIRAASSCARAATCRSAPARARSGVSRFRTAISSAASSCPRCAFEVVQRELVNGCLILNLRKVHLNSMNSDAVNDMDTTDAARRRRPAGRQRGCASARRRKRARRRAARSRGRCPDDALIILPMRNLVLFPGVVLPITIGREKSRARGAGSRAPAAPDRRAAPDQAARSTIRGPKTCTGSARPRTCCATSRARTARITSSRRARSAFACSSSSTAGISRSRASSAFRKPRAGRHRDRGARADAEAARGRDPAPAAAGAGRDGRRASRTSKAPRSSPISSRASWTRRPKRSRRCSRRSICARASTSCSSISPSASKCSSSRARSTSARKESIESHNREHLLRERMQAIQKELGDDDEGAAELEELEKAIAEAGMPEDVEKQARKELKRLERMPEASGEYSMVRTYLEWLIELPWKNAGADDDRHRRSAAHPRRGPLRPREDQEAHPRVPRGAQAEPDGQEPDPVLRRPARRGQDLARPEHRARDGARVRAREPGRRARRSGDPRPSAHVHRRAAGQHHPEHPQGGDEALR